MSSAFANPLLAFAVTALIVELTPGPNMTYLAALSLSKGARAGLAAVTGVALGLSLSGIAAALGLAAIIDSSRFLYEACDGAASPICFGWHGKAGPKRSKAARPKKIPMHCHAGH